MSNKLCYIGFDISTSNIGLSVFNEKGELVELKHLSLDVDKDVKPEFRYIFKSDIFKKYLLDYKTHLYEELDYKVEKIFIEEPLERSINLNTTVMLAKFNGICSYILYEVFEIIPEHISVYESRKLFFPEYIKYNKVKDKKTKQIVIKETLSLPKTKDVKDLILDKVSELYPQIEWIYTEKGKNAGKIHKKSYDMSDSVVVTHSMLRKHNII